MAVSFTMRRETRLHVFLLSPLVSPGVCPLLFSFLFSRLLVPLFEELGRTDLRAAQRAKLETREAKRDVDRETLRGVWTEAASELGLTSPSGARS